MTRRCTALLVLLACCVALPASADRDATRDDEPPAPVASAYDDASGNVTFDWKDVPIAVVVQAVVGDLLGTTFEIAPGVQGRVTYRTPKPISKWEALAVLEQQLAANGSVLVRLERGYLVQPVAGIAEPH